MNLFCLVSEDCKLVKNHRWSRLLARVFKVDVSTCTKSGGALHIISAISDPDQARRYLKHRGLDYEPPPRGPPGMVQSELEFCGTCEPSID